MSAFVVSDRHVAAMLTFGVRAAQCNCLRRSECTCALRPADHGRSRLFWPAPDHVAPAAVHLVQDGERGQAWGADAVRLAVLLDRELSEATVDRVGAILVAANTASVNFRYGQDELEGLYVHHPVDVDVVQVLKAIDCYEYQACESPAWERSEARAICAALRARAVCQLPGYDDAEWML